MASARARLSAQLVIGCMVVVLGVLFTLDNLSIMDSEPILKWWPIVLVLIGVSKLLDSRCRSRMISGILFTVAGGWLLLHNLGFVDYSIWELWPLALVVAGASLVMGSLRRTQVSAPTGDAADYANAFVMMGGINRKMITSQFRGGETTAFMGGIELDLRDAKAATDTVVIQVLAWWGGVEIRVPKDWKVTSEVLPIMAGLEDQTRVEPDAKTHLIVKGMVVMGGVELKN